MSEEKRKAEQLLGYQFFHNPETPTFGILRLDTKNEQHWLLVNRKSLRLLAEACAKHSEELPEIQ